MKGKRGVFWENWTPWIIGIAVLVIILLAASFVFKDKLWELARYLKSLF